MSGGEYFIGLISGTSVDGIDAVVLRIDGDRLEIAGHHCEPYPEPIQRELLALAQPGDNEIDRLGAADRNTADCFSKAVAAVLDRAGLTAADIRAVGSHGQTIRHRPEGATPFTLQIGDPNRIAEQTGITTVADFRRRDMAAGGQGAPLVPAFHRAVFGVPHRTTAVVNIGGIANVTLLGADGSIQGFDTGPGNTLMDAWIREHRGTAFDQGGAWAATGTVDPALLEQLLKEPYFRVPAPKSTGPELFSPDWLREKLTGDMAPEDVQRTLLELTARTVSDALAGTDSARVAICGGGAHNPVLMARLEALLDPAEVVSTETLGIAPDWVEAAAFAWLASRTLAGLPGNEPDATGAGGPRVLGGIYPA